MDFICLWEVGGIARDTWTPQFSYDCCLLNMGKYYHKLNFLPGETEAHRLKLSQNINGRIVTAIQVSGFQSPK